MALLGVAISLFVVSALLLWNPYDRRQADEREPGASELKTVAGQDFEPPSVDTPPGEGLPDAASPHLRQPANEDVVELDLQPVVGALREPVVDDRRARDSVYRPTRDAGFGGESGAGGGGDGGDGNGGRAGSSAEDAGAESAVLPEPAAGGAAAGGAAADNRWETPAPTGFDPCGMIDCPFGTVCCNPSCGLCSPPGGVCSSLTCSMPTFPISVTCGRNTCDVGEVCCNMSCGICTGPDETCSQRVCD